MAPNMAVMCISYIGLSLEFSSSFCLHTILFCDRRVCVLRYLPLSDQIVMGITIINFFNSL